MDNFSKQYGLLNKAQRSAVDYIDGPLLVAAGPGTGKTQLLSMRVANILKKTDITPANILCLTFTDNAARNMRERLAGIIGQPAYHIAIHTFHSFGVEIINRYPDHFVKRQLLQQVDELGQYQLLQEIFEKLPYSNPLSTKVGEQFIHLKPALETIGWLKQNALTPGELKTILQSNNKFIEAIEPKITETFVSTPNIKQLSLYQDLLKEIQKYTPAKGLFGFPAYATECATELEEALDKTEPDAKSAKHITAWRNRWCKKDARNNYVFKDGGQNHRKMLALADVYQTLTDEMARQGLYDFNDMVIEAVHAVEADEELRFNLQEQHQYILVDEFQDTNKAQLRMLAALGNNPANEGRPNIMAVGDDDQAIYAFQGAEVSNMTTFIKMYNPKIIPLKENYRNSDEILEAGYLIADQITDRLESIIPDAAKQLQPKQDYSQKLLDHSLFVSEVAQYDWVAERIKQLIKEGMEPSQIAVISSKHKYLERLMPYLGSLGVPVAYERRENILDSPIIIQLLTMSELVVAIAENRQDDTDAFMSEVLSYDFWQLPDEDLVQLSLDCYNKHKHWLEVLKNHKNPTMREISAWFVDLAKRSSLEPMEYMLDQLIGTGFQGVDSEYDELLPSKSKAKKFVSNLRNYYFNTDRYEKTADTYLSLLGQLSTLRHRLRQWKPNQALYIKDFIDYARLHRLANIKIVDTNPHTQTTNAVHVMTAYKAKGLEFDVVFVINAQDEVWGPTARGGSSGISLPKNLPLQPAGNENNDKLRLFFVALTRARHTLHITSYANTFDNKPSPALSFLTKNDSEEVLHPAFIPDAISQPADAKAVEILSTDWAYRFRQVIADKQTLFEPILKNYKLSVTHLNNFLDVAGGGPYYFFIHNLLRFPEALSPSAAYGDSVHKTFKWAHGELRSSGKLPAIKRLQEYFTDMLQRAHLQKNDFDKLNQRGRQALELYFKNRSDSLSAGDMVERGFNNEGVIINTAHLSGNIDRLHFTSSAEAVVFDFKTGKPSTSWQGKDEFEKIKLYKYKQQLMFYKLLVEHSASFHKKLSVSKGEIEYVEPDASGNLTDNLVLVFDHKEMERFAKLIGVVWRHINSLDFPDVGQYKQSLSGIKQFEQDLLDGKF